MPTVVHRFDWPDRFVVGTVGVPGHRTFYLQARTADDLISVKVEKEQSLALAERIDEVLDELMGADGNPFSIPGETAPELDDIDPLDEPIEAQFHGGVMSLGWDPSTAQVVIEVFPVIEVDPDQLPFETLENMEPEEVLVVRIPVGSARAFSKRTREVVAAGRPLCTLCGLPMDADHVCELPDDFR
ncbi:MAG TPA: DUF3090 domain-containing protein [Aeromicrobium sp.]|nr:DUF3090 domain-containing protein [Aeromicrobium sp.]